MLQTASLQRYQLIEIFYQMSGRYIIWWGFTTKSSRHNSWLDRRRKTDAKE